MHSNNSHLLEPPKYPSCGEQALIFLRSASVRCKEYAFGRRLRDMRRQPPAHRPLSVAKKAADA